MFSYINTDFTPGKGYTPIVHGNSYIQVVTWDEAGIPDARGILTYSQSPEPDSAHYADQTQLYSDGEWLDLPFTEEDILGDPNLVTLTLTDSP
jgi:acyl-homoserine-lactone acylase